MNESKRPVLHKGLDSESFQNWYWLKEELVQFCRENGLPSSGGKETLAERISYFLDTGKLKGNISLPKRQRAAKPVSDITPDSLIESDFVCSERHREFFKEQIGSSFSFNVMFQKWLKSNSGRTYADAVAAYYEIRESRKSAKKTIDRQFEYNTYIRDFFEQNRGCSLDEAIRCWKYKKSLPGHNRYEEADLAALKDE